MSDNSKPPVPPVPKIRSVSQYSAVYRNVGYPVEGHSPYINSDMSLFVSPVLSTISSVATQDITEAPALMDITRQRSISQESFKSLKNLRDSHDHDQDQALKLVQKHDGTDHDDDDTTEQTPLLKPTVPAQSPRPQPYAHTQAYQKQTDIPTASDEQKQSSVQIEWPSWCPCFLRDDVTPPPHPIASLFTNEQFRQSYTGRILGVKGIQALVTTLASLVPLLLWNYNWNEHHGTPIPVLIIADYRWILLLPLVLYVLLMIYVRFVTPEWIRRHPGDLGVLLAVTFLLSVLASGVTVGFADVIHVAIVPVAFGTLGWSYFMLRRLVTSDLDGNFYVDVTTTKIYYAVAPVLVTGTVIVWPTVYALLTLSDSVVTANLVTSLLFEGLPVIGIDAVVLLMDIHHLKRVLNGNRISIITEDYSEVIFASFFI